MENTSFSTLEIFLLGRFRLKLGGVLLDERLWTRRSSRQLIQLLALQPAHQLHREQIIDILWAEQDLSTALNNLNKAIHAARRVLEPRLKKGAESRFIQTSSSQVILCSPDKLLVDVEEFERLALEALETEDPKIGEAALNIYRGPLLTEDIYEDWLTAKRESLHLLYRKVANKTAEIYTRSQEYQRALELLKKICLEDPTDERVHQNLMRLYAATGSKYQALKQYEQCLAALRELDMEPEEDTVKLKDLIKAGKVPIDKSNFDRYQKPQSVSSSAQQPSYSLSVEKRHWIEKHPRQSQAEVRQLTFQQGVIYTARFAKDQQAVFYSASWESSDLRTYKINRTTFESQTVGLNGAGIHSVSSEGDLALSLKRRFVRGFIAAGTLARLQHTGTLADKILEGVQWADWHPDKSCQTDPDAGRCLAVVRDAGGRNRLEYPIGNVLHETGGWISHPRFSPSGRYLAFIDHPTPADDSGAVAVIDLEATGKSRRRMLTASWVSIQGLAWKATDDEIWFTAAKSGNARSIYSVSLDGKQERLVFRGVGSLTLHDLSRAGQALITMDKTRVRVAARISGETEERDLSWHDWSLVRDVSEDGKTVLFTEAGASGGQLYCTYIRGTDGSGTVSLGEGSALALSPDKKCALVKLLTVPNQLVLLSASGDGILKRLKPNRTEPLNYHPWACWLADGKRVLFAANLENSGTRLYVQHLDGEPECITPDLEGVELSSPHSISPRGDLLAMITADDKICLYSIKDKRIVGYPPIKPNYLPIRWSKDGRYLFVRERGAVPALIYRCELSGGKMQRWHELMPKDTTGVHEILRVLLTPDAESYAYSYTRDLSDLFIVEGLE